MNTRAGNVTAAHKFGNFYHTADGVFFPTQTDVVLIGGDDTLFFVPEPVSLLLLVTGLPGLLFSRRRA